MNKLLAIKHWLLFAIMFVPSIIVEVFDLTGFWYLIAESWTMFLYFFWLYSIGINLSRNNLKSKFGVILFKAAFIFSIIVLVFSSFYDSPLDLDTFPVWLISVLIGVMVSTVYLIFFAAQNLVRFEIDRDISNSGIFLTFCAFWFFPIGIFFVQPRLNQVQQLIITASDVDLNN
jgi:hypothetical protein